MHEMSDEERAAVHAGRYGKASAGLALGLSAAMARGASMNIDSEAPVRRNRSTRYHSAYVKYLCKAQANKNKKNKNRAKNKAARKARRK